MSIFNSYTLLRRSPKTFLLGSLSKSAIELGRRKTQSKRLKKDLRSAPVTDGCGGHSHTVKMLHCVLRAAPLILLKPLRQLTKTVEQMLRNPPQSPNLSSVPSTTRTTRAGIIIIAVKTSLFPEAFPSSPTTYRPRMVTRRFTILVAIHFHSVCLGFKAVASILDFRFGPPPVAIKLFTLPIIRVLFVSQVDASCFRLRWGIARRLIKRLSSNLML